MPELGTAVEHLMISTSALDECMLLCLVEDSQFCPLCGANPPNVD